MSRVRASNATDASVKPRPGLVLLISVVMAVWGCAPIWQPVQGRLGFSGGSISVPDGWLHFAAPTYDMLSKDGPYLQYILIQERPLSQGFQNTSQKIEAGMLSHEIAQIILDNLKADKQIREFRLSTNAPATVGGRPGFKLIFTYQDVQGVDMQTIYYGTVHADRFINLRYTAAQRHYFSMDQSAFDEVFQSLRLAATQ